MLTRLGPRALAGASLGALPFHKAEEKEGAEFAPSLTELPEPPSLVPA